MDSLPHKIVATEGKRDIRYAARNQGMRQGLLDPAGRLDEVDTVGVVFLDTGGHRKYIGVEDNILRRESHLLR